MVKQLNLVPFGSEPIDPHYVDYTRRHAVVAAT